MYYDFSINMSEIEHFKCQSLKYWAAKYFKLWHLKYLFVFYEGATIAPTNWFGSAKIHVLTFLHVRKNKSACYHNIFHFISFKSFVKFIN